MFDVKGNSNAFKNRTETLEQEVLEIKTFISQAKDDFDNKVIGVEDYLAIKSSFEKDLIKLSEDLDKTKLGSFRQKKQQKKSDKTVFSNNEPLKLTRLLINTMIDRIVIDKNKKISIILQ